jgi:beta-galactosidase/beta-glucuronidase
VSLFLQAEEFTPWDLENPVLYNLRASLLEGGVPLHMASERIGFRTIECQGTQIMLNDKPLFVRGFNRYDEIEPYG